MWNKCISLYSLDPCSFGNTAQDFNSGNPHSSGFESLLKGVTKIADAQYQDLPLQVPSQITPEVR